MSRANERWFVPRSQPWRGLVMGGLLLVVLPLYLLAGAAQGLRWWLGEVRYAITGY